MPTVAGDSSTSGRIVRQPVLRERRDVEGRAAVAVEDDAMRQLMHHGYQRNVGASGDFRLQCSRAVRT